MASNDDDGERSTPTSTSTSTSTSGDASNVMLTRAGARRQEAERVERARAAFDAIPNDLIVSIFERASQEEPPSDWDPYDRDRRRSHSLRWVRETFPLVCRAWRDLYRSQQASPLHETLQIDFGVEFPEDDEDEQDLEAAPAGPIVHAARVLAWAERYRRDIRRLLVSGRYASYRQPRDFSSQNLAEIVQVLAPGLDAIEIVTTALCSLVRAPFWESLRDFVAPVGRLRRLVVSAIDIPLFDGGAVAEGDVDVAEGDGDVDVDVDDGDVDVDDGDVDVAESNVDVAFLRGLTSLEHLVLRREENTYGEDFVDWGLRGFPSSISTLTNLLRVDLSINNGITALPAGISSLRRLASLRMSRCSFAWLPEELGALGSLTRLDISENLALGGTAVDVAFPPALGGLTSMRRLDLSYCGLRSVPPFTRELRGLEYLRLDDNELEGADAWPPRHVDGEAPIPQQTTMTHLDLRRCNLSSVPPAVLASMPRLRVLNLSHNRLTALPADLGQRLPELREINLSSNRFEAVPLRALASASSLEVIDLRGIYRLQVEEPLDVLVDNLPRLQRVYFWTDSERHHWEPREMRMRRPWRSWTPTSRANLEALRSALQARDPDAVVVF